MIRFIVLAGLLSIAISDGWPQPQIRAVVNAASFQPGLPAGGSLATAFCPVFASSKPGTYIAPSSTPLPFELGGIAVTVNNAIAPILAVVIPSSDQSAYAQVNFQVPLERNTSILANYGSDFGAPGILACGSGVMKPLPQMPFGAFFSDGNGYAAAQHASDYSPVTPDNPAHAGEAIIAYADDFFPVWPPPPVGFATPQQPLFPKSQFASATGGPGYLYLQDYPQPDFKGNSFTQYSSAADYV